MENYIFEIIGIVLFFSALSFYVGYFLKKEKKEELRQLREQNKRLFTDLQIIGRISRDPNCTPKNVDLSCREVPLEFLFPDNGPNKPLRKGPPYPSMDMQMIPTDPILEIQCYPEEIRISHRSSFGAIWLIILSLSLFSCKKEHGSGGCWYCQDQSGQTLNVICAESEADAFQAYQNSTSDPVTIDDFRHRCPYQH